MANFPTLKTGAIAQYPLERANSFSNAVYRFVDGGEQRIPRRGASLRRWKIALQLLDESELTALSDFFEAQGGCAGTFSFTDPWDGTVYSHCRFDSDAAVFRAAGVSRGETALVVREHLAA